MVAISASVYEVVRDVCVVGRGRKCKVHSSIGLIIRGPRTTCIVVDANCTVNSSVTKTE